MSAGTQKTLWSCPSVCLPTLQKIEQVCRKINKTQNGTYCLSLSVYTGSKNWKQIAKSCCFGALGRPAVLWMVLCEVLNKRKGSKDIKWIHTFGSHLWDMLHGFVVGISWGNFVEELLNYMAYGITLQVNLVLLSVKLKHSTTCFTKLKKKWKTRE